MVHCQLLLRSVGEYVLGCALLSPAKHASMLHRCNITNVRNHSLMVCRACYGAELQLCQPEPERH